MISYRIISAMWNSASQDRTKQTSLHLVHHSCLLCSHYAVMLISNPCQNIFLQRLSAVKYNGTESERDHNFAPCLWGRLFLDACLKWVIHFVQEKKQIKLSCTAQTKKHLAAFLFTILFFCNMICWSRSWTALSSYCTFIKLTSNMYCRRHCLFSCCLYFYTKEHFTQQLS